MSRSTRSRSSSPRNPTLVRLLAILVAATTAIVLQPATASRAASIIPPPTTSTELSAQFVIGVDQQPSSLFPTWVGRGINTVVRLQGGNNNLLPSSEAAYQAWDAAALENGLLEIRGAANPSNPDYTSDSAVPNLIAYTGAGHDEPETHYCLADGPSTELAIQAAAREVHRPFFTNYAGPWIMNDTDNNLCNAAKTPAGDYCDIPGGTGGNPSCYPDYFRATDVISFDNYPFNSGTPLDVVRAEMNRISTVYGGANNGPPRMAYVEASDFSGGCSSNRLTGNKVSFQTVLSVIMGVRGIIYFPEVPGASCFDHTTAGIAAEMTRVNCALSPSRSPACPPNAIPGPIMQSTISPINGAFESGTTSGQILSGNRADSAVAYIFTVNDSASSYSHVVRFHTQNCANQVVTAINDVPTPLGTFVAQDRTIQLDQFCQTPAPETFGAYGYHIYQIATPGLALVP